MRDELMDTNAIMPEKWALKPSPKTKRKGLSRTVPSKDTVEHVLPLMDKIGVDIDEGIKRIDTNKIPAFIVRQHREGKDKYYKGKGYTEDDSRASAVMEAIERYSAERYSGQVTYCSYEEIIKNGAAVNPDDLHARVTPYYRAGMAVDWVEGFDIIGNRNTFVPLSMVVMPYTSRIETFCSSSSGLGAGNTIEEALLHSMCEIIEHDSNAMSNLFNPNKCTITFTRTQDQSSAEIRESLPRDPTPDLMFPLIDIKSLPKQPATIAKRLIGSGLILFARNTTTDIGIPSVYCTLVKKYPDERHIIYDGMGAHPDAEIAILRALCEAAQSYSTYEWMYETGLFKAPNPLQGDPYELYGYGSTCHFSDIDSYKHARVDDDIRFIKEKLKAVGLNQIVVVDLTKQEIGIPVVRMIIPKTEYLHTEPDAQILGPRGKKLVSYREQQYIAMLRKMGIV